MKRFFKVFLSIFISILILLAILIPSISSSSFYGNKPKNILDVKWYTLSNNEELEVEIPSKLDVNKNQTCTIYGYIDTTSLSSPTLALRTSYQKLDVYVEDILIYSYDTESYRPYGKANPSKIHYISLSNELVDKKISISITSAFTQYSGYISNIEIGNYDTVLTNTYVVHHIELIFGIFIVLLSIFLLLSNAIVVKFGEVSKSIYYMFGASFFLGLWMVFDSKFINVFLNEFLVGQFVYVSLHAFAIMFSLFVNSLCLKYLKPMSIFIVVLSILNLIVQNFLHLFNILDYVEMLFVTLGLIFIEVLFYLVDKIIKNHIKTKKTIPDRLEVFVSISILIAFIINVYLLTNTFNNINVLLGILFTLLTIIIHDKAIYQISETAEASKELKARLSQTQNYLIQSQMKPHFIFNTLGAIRTMIKSSPDKAYNLTTSFSKYLRANINNISPTETISFAQEMDHVKTYVDIEKQRFGDRLTVLYDINCENFNIPPLTVEPLVENAVKHGVCKRVKGGTVKISSREEEDKYIVTVEDDGVGFDVQELNDETGSVGLKYIKLRLKELSNADFKIESKKGVGTIATLTFFK